MEIIKFFVIIQYVKSKKNVDLKHFFFQHVYSLKKKFIKFYKDIFIFYLAIKLTIHDIGRIILKLMLVVNLNIFMTSGKSFEFQF